MLEGTIFKILSILSSGLRTLYIMFLPPYYAQNNPGIIGSTLFWSLVATIASWL